MLINRLLMDCGCRHFEARQSPVAAEFWHHLNTTVWLEVCRAHTKARKQVLARNNSRTKLNNLVKTMPWITHNHISLSQRNHYKMRIILIVSKKSRIIEESARRTGNPNWCLCELSVLLVQVTSEHLTFLLPVFKSGIRHNHNGSSPVIWIIPLYLWYQVYLWLLLWNFWVLF